MPGLVVVVSVGNGLETSGLDTDFSSGTLLPGLNRLETAAGSSVASSSGKAAGVFVLHALVPVGSMERVRRRGLDSDLSGLGDRDGNKITQAHVHM